MNDGQALRWRHNGRYSVSNHQPHDCLFNCLFRRRSKKTSKIRVTGLCVWGSPGTGEFPAQMASNAENVPFDDVMISLWHIYISKYMAISKHYSCPISSVLESYFIILVFFFKIFNDTFWPKRPSHPFGLHPSPIYNWYLGLHQYSFLRYYSMGRNTIWGII